MNTEKDTNEKMSCLNDFRDRFQKSSVFRQKVFYTFCIYLIFFSTGWVRGLLGPSFADLLVICNVDLEKGSWIITTFFIGYTIGSMMGGFLYARVNRMLLFAISHILLGCTFFAIPWCYKFELITTLYLIQGTAQGVVDPAAQAEILGIWKTKMIFLGLKCVFSIGGTISPLVLAPFLIEVTDRKNIYTYDYNLSQSLEFNENFSLPIANYSKTLTEKRSQESNIYVAFSISGGIFLIVAILFFISHFLEVQTKTKLLQNSPDNQLVNISRNLKFSFFVSICIMFFFVNGISEIFFSFLSVFCLSQLEWSKLDGARIISIGYFTEILSGIFGVILVKCLNTQVFVAISLGFAFLSVGALTMSAKFLFNIGVWISVLFHIFAKGNVFALLFTWTNEYITPMTGMISSLFLIISMIGSSVNPVLTGFLMEEYTPLWLCYIIMIEYCIILLSYIAMVYQTKLIVKNVGTVSNRLKRTEDNCSMMTET